jgi:hypothetical protein
LWAQDYLLGLRTTAYSNGVEVKKSHTNGAAAWQKKKEESVKRRALKKDYARTGWLRALATDVDFAMLSIENSYSCGQDYCVYIKATFHSKN